MEPTDYQTEIVAVAGRALLAQQPVTVTHEAGWKRSGFPLPIKKMAPSSDGTTTQQYRPLALLEYVNGSLSGELASRQAAARKAKEQAE